MPHALVLSRTPRLLPLLLAAGVLGCATQVVESPRSGGALAGVAPVLSVERFLQAVNAQDFDAMARIFGTVDGPVEGPAQEVELRMATIAEILRHQDYKIDSERMEPGRANPTRRVGVDLTIDRRVIRDVAFMVVQTREGNWMVEQIDLEKVTGG
ncbi:MAG TPA: hypothetical protein VLA43_15420 [Longimicrobiales bacterium]|nr:hypothetical protein [Longimicrobiales bacterium]